MMTVDGKWFPVLVWAASVLIAATVAYTTSNLRLDHIESQKLTRAEFLDTLQGRRLQDTLMAYRMREVQRTLDTLDVRTRRMERRLCGEIPRGQEC